MSLLLGLQRFSLQSAAHIPGPFRLSGWAWLQCWKPRLVSEATCLCLGEGVGGVSTPQDPLCTSSQPLQWPAQFC